MTREALITLDFKETDIRDVLRTISYQQGINLVADAEVVGPVTIRLVDVPVDDALELLVSSYGWRLERRDNIYHVRAGSGGPLWIETNEGRIDLRANGALLHQVLLALGEAEGVSIVPTGTPSGAVYVSLSGVTFQEALDAVLAGSEFAWRQEGGLYYVEPKTVVPSTPVLEAEASVTPDPASEPVVRHEDGLLSVYGIDVPLRPMLYRLAEESNLGLILHSSVVGHITMRWDHAEATELLVQTARMGGFTARRLEADVWWVGPAEVAERLFPSEQESEVDALEPTEEPGDMEKRTLPPGAFTAQVADGLAWLTAWEAPARDVLMDLGERAQLNVSLPVNLDSLVTIQLEGVPVEQALTWVAETAGLTATYDGTLWRLEPSYRSNYVQMDHLSIAEVSARVGYASSTSFTKAFKKEYGIAPSDMRRS